MKLKTLKDLRIIEDYIAPKVVIDKENKDGTISQREITKEELIKEIPYANKSIRLHNLRQEAINWIKEMKAPNWNYGKIANELGEEVVFDVEGWIKHFFNITEEDLK